MLVGKMRILPMKMCRPEDLEITYDKNVTNLDEIFKVFFTVHDPTTLNRQGADVGTQYRSAIFNKNEAQKKSAQTIIRAMKKAKIYDSPIVTTVEPLIKFTKPKIAIKITMPTIKINPFVKW